jgi:hypothetical protein
MSKNLKMQELSKALGVRYLDVIPPDQYLWQQLQVGVPPLYRLWSWMIDHTMHIGRRSAYAISGEGAELHLANAAEDLGMDEHTIYRYWNEGAKRGLWRNGTKKGERKKALYLNGNVTPTEVLEEAESGYEIVCTDNLPPYILNQIKDWPPERRQLFLAERETYVRIRKDAIADLTAAARTILDQLDDTQFRQWGLEKRRETKLKGNLDPEAVAERQQRLSGILSPLELYVQTIRDRVQTEENGVYKAVGANATDNPSLLNERTTREPLDVRGTQKIYRGASGEAKAKSFREGASSGTGSRQAAEENLVANDAEKQAKLDLALQLKQMQKSFPNTDFGTATFNPDTKPGQIYLTRVIDAVGAENVTAFCLSIASRFKGLDRGGMGKLPARAPGAPHGPRGLGLILEWAEDFGKGAKAKGASS